MASTMPMSALLSALRGAGRQHLTASSFAARQTITGSHVLRLHGYTQVLGKKFPTGKSLESPTFAVGGHDWKIICYPNGLETAYDGHTSLFLRSVSLPSAAVVDAPTARLEASVLDRAGKPWRTRTTEPMTFFSRSKSWGWNDFVKNDDLNLVDDCLTVLCDVTLQDPPLHVEDVTDAQPPEPTAAAVPPPFDEPIWRSQPTDVTVHAGGEKFAAHRSVLEARSPVFKADLEKATTWGHLHVDGVDAQVFKALLQFMYTDVLPSDWNQHQLEVEQLLAAADRYGLEKLKLACGEALGERIKMDSVAPMLALADQHKCAVLKEACMKFLSVHGDRWFWGAEKKLSNYCIEYLSSRSSCQMNKQN